MQNTVPTESDAQQLQAHDLPILPGVEGSNDLTWHTHVGIGNLAVPDAAIRNAKQEGVPTRAVPST